MVWYIFNLWFQALSSARKTAAGISWAQPAGDGVVVASITEYTQTSLSCMNGSRKTRNEEKIELEIDLECYQNVHEKKAK